MWFWTPLPQLRWPSASLLWRVDLASVIIWHLGNHESPAANGKQIQFPLSALLCCAMPSLWVLASTSRSSGCCPRGRASGERVSMSQCFVWGHRPAFRPPETPHEARDLNCGFWFLQNVCKTLLPPSLLAQPVSYSGASTASLARAPGPNTAARPQVLSPRWTGE